MRFPSLYLAWNNAIAVARRFPLVLGAAVGAATGMILIVELSGDHPRLDRAAATLMAALPLFFLIQISAERWNWPPRRKLAVWVGGLGFLGVVYAALHAWPDPIAGGRYVQLQGVLHFAVAVVPFLIGRKVQAFWQFNRTLFVRFLVALLFSHVLYVGLAVAVVATDKLLGVNVPDKFYLYLWLVLAIVFQSWFFLGGVPRDLEALESDSDYPVALRVFAQFILIPLVSLYVLLLSVYLAKIIVTTTWPSGWVGYLVSSVAVAGILTVLLTHPLREQEEHRWVGVFSRWYFIGLLPPVVMALMAAWKRIEQYGFTEARYALVVLALWLGSMAVYYTIKGVGNIKLIPASLGALILATMFGPWSAYGVSSASQTARLERLLVGQELMENGLLSPASGDVPFDERREISATLRFLFDREATSELDRWLDGKLSTIDTLTRGDGYRNQFSEARTVAVMNHLNMEYVNRWDRGPSSTRFLYAERLGARKITGYDYAAWLETGDAASDTIIVAGRTLSVTFSEGRDSILVMEAGAGAVGGVALEPGLREAWTLVQQTPNESSVPAEILRWEGGSDELKVLFYISSLNFTEEDGRLVLNNVAGNFYFAWR